jgi:hypothetical protein
MSWEIHYHFNVCYQVLQYCPPKLPCCRVWENGKRAEKLQYMCQPGLPTFLQTQPNSLHATVLGDYRFCSAVVRTVSKLFRFISIRSYISICPSMFNVITGEDWRCSTRDIKVLYAQKEQNIISNIIQGCVKRINCYIQLFPIPIKRASLCSSMIRRMIQRIEVE